MTRGARGGERPRWQGHTLAGSLFFFLGTDLFIISPLIPEIARYFGVTPQETAAVAVAFGATYTVLGPFAALFTDQLTRKNAIFIGGTVFALGGILAGISPSLDVLVVARVISAVGASLMGAPIWSYVTETAKPGKTGAAVALVSGLFASGQIVGVPLGALLAATGRWQLAFIAVGMAGLISSVLVKAFLGVEDRVPVRVGPWSAFKTSLGIWGRPDIRIRIGANLFGQGARISAYTFAGSIMTERFGFATATLGAIGAGVGLGSLLGSLLGGWLVTIAQRRRWSQSPIGGWSALTMAAALYVAVVSDVGLVAVVAWIFTFVAGSCLVSNNQEIIARTAGNQRAFALSWNNSALYAGTAAGTALLSLVPLGGQAFAAIAVAFAVVSAAFSFGGWRPERRALADG